MAIQLTHGSLFSGIGGFDYAAEQMGWENLFHCEWNPFGRKILNYYWPQATSYEDITKTNFTIWRDRIDLISGGFPCQPYSAAGKRLGKEDERHLWPQMLRAIKEIKPSWVVGENVHGIVNWSGDWSSSKCKLTWKLKGTKYNRIYFQLAPKTPPTDEIEFGLLLTPTAVMTDEHPDAMRARAKKNGTKYGSLLSQVKYSELLPTPTTQEPTTLTTELTSSGRRKTKDGKSSRSLNLGRVVGLLPTPDASIRGARKNQNGHQVTLQDVVAQKTPQAYKIAEHAGLLPTQTTRDYKDTFKSQEKLNNQYKKRMSPSIALTVGYKTGSTSQLNPRFVAEMMGFPPNWTELPFLNGEMNQ